MQLELQSLMDVIYNIIVVGELFEFMGAIFISVATAFIGYLIITSESYQNNIISPLAPTLV
jgi:hypothetical protein